ncbi:hypothetical protein PIB30_059836 [Stylosanthes scabra]|uniref:Uncharacterized protein n=1 Tax=Stylosanthes scabra TaxID=79078 RepID=A0ABU6WKE9_9FABA|nr:hypothetical protein [Stylosanthes scabra]
MPCANTTRKKTSSGKFFEASQSNEKLKTLLYRRHDITKITYDELREKLLAHEITHIGQDTKSKSIALKSKISSKEEESDEDDNESDDEFELFARRLRRMMREPGHYKLDCSQKKKDEINKKDKNKVLMTSWEDLENDFDDNDSDQEAQLYFMADSTEFDEVDFSNLSNKELLDMINDITEDFEKFI